ncbi:esterase [Cytophaga sp. FL35]|uniref:alpha/beta hydrolase n=1 Tax=Cytophaga sp. FL35 TaxID=1904456 RepID=UPI001653D6B1|nr:esterase [Cytophaga sp. FL35]MBC6999209.1 esterase [Cytophaga sp. FL35]
MSQKERLVSYTSTNSYLTLNELTSETQNIWIVFHGLGFLSRYFITYFNGLPPEKNYIIAPQAPSKYYLNNQYRHVGASWLTKEETVRETQNVLSYIDAVMGEERLPSNKNLIVLGFSQGVSIATRWVASRKIKCEQLILYAGGIPNELTPNSFDFLKKHKTKITALIGNEDEYLDENRIQKENEKLKMLFGEQAQQIIFDGKHEVKNELINNLVL